MSNTNTLLMLLSQESTMKSIMLALILIVSIAGCTTNQIPTIDQSNNEPFIVESESPASSPISVNLIVSAFAEQPKLGSEADLILEVTVHESYDKPLSNTTVNIDLPQGMMRIDGDTEWIGDLTNENPLILNARVKFTEIGNLTLKSSARWYFTEDSWLGGTAQICFSVSEDKISMKKGTCPTQTILPSGIKELDTEPPTFNESTDEKS